MKNISAVREPELKRVVEIIKNTVPVEKIILFGSFARGDWVSDRYREDNVTYEYQSDYDVLVIVRSEKIEKDIDLWAKVQKLLDEDAQIKAPVSLVVDTIHFVNQRIAEGNYFYSDIKREGVVLYDSGAFELVEPGQMTLAEQKQLMQKNFDFWFGKSQSFLKDFMHNVEDDELNNAAFHLNQVAESLYSAVLLVYTGYKPKSHNLEKIQSLVVDVLPKFAQVFPCATTEERRRFELLKRAYVDARYKQDYQVHREDLDYLAERINALQTLTKKACEEKIASM
jgi:predicted nucleotidyltransferase/HEPN domain-containing protein